MLKKILCISGRPGLYELKSHGKNMIIVEGLIDKKRLPVHARDKVISLGDISIYTTDQDEPLGNVLQNIYDKQEGKPLDMGQYADDKSLDAFFAEVLPSYDADRVYRSDIKKLMNWYNLLVAAGKTDFLPEKEEEAATDEKAEKTEE